MMNRSNSEKIVVMHLRSSSGSGGGPEKTIYKTALFLDSTRFLYLVVYLKKRNDELTISRKAAEAGLNYYELTGRSFIDIKQIVQLAKIIRLNKVQILHCHDPKTDFYGYILNICFPSLAIISTIHGWIKRSGKSLFYISLDKFLLRYFDAVIAVSSDMKRAANLSGIKNTRLIHNAIDINEWDPAKSTPRSLLFQKNPNSFVVGYVGRLSKEKGALDFVMVSQKVLEEAIAGELIEFLVAGEGPEIGAMKTLAADFGILDHYTFLGQVDSKAMVSLYREIDVLLSTSYSEGLPNNLLEAGAMYVPVVATDVGGVSDIISDRFNGLLSAPGDIRTLASHVMAIKRDKNLADMLKANGRLIVTEKFSFSARVKKIEALYKSIAHAAEAQV